MPLGGARATYGAELLAAAEAGLKSGGGRESALSAAQDALILFREIQDEASTTRALHVLAQLHLKAGKYEEALARAEEALDLFLAREQRVPEEAKVAATAVEALLALGRSGAALRLARHAWEACQEGGLLEGEASMLELVAVSYADLGLDARAERAAQRALRLYAGKLRDEAGEKRVLHSIARFRLERGVTGTAEAAADTVAAPVAFAQAGNLRSAAETLLDVAETHMGNGRDADLLTEARALRERCSGPSEAAASGIALLAAAFAHLGLRQMREAMQAAREAAEAFEDEGEVYYWACALSMIARVYFEREQLPMAQQYARSAGRKFAACGKRTAKEASMRILLAHTMLAGPQAERRPKDAAQEGEAALALARELGDRALQAHALTAITKAHTLSGKPEASLQAAQRALQLVDEKDVDGKAVLLLHSMDLCLVLNRFEEALTLSSEMVGLAEKDGDAKFKDLTQQILQKVEICQRA